MQLNLTTGYAVRVLVYLAEENGNICSSAEMSERLKISQKYLMRISKKMRDAGFLASHPGNVGGYSLARPPEQIRLYDVALLMEGTVKLHRCLEEDHYCSQKIAATCRTLHCFAVMQVYWENFLKRITIADLAAGLSVEEVQRRITGPPGAEGEGQDHEHKEQTDKR